MNTKSILDKLTAHRGAAGMNNIANAAAELLSPYCAVTTDQMGNVIGTIAGDNSRHIMLEAHADEVGFIVTHVDDDGFANVANCGGIDGKMLPGTAVTIHAEIPIPGVFCSTPPHLSKDGGQPQLCIDAGLGANAAKEQITPGTPVTFDITPATLPGGQYTGAGLDNRAGLASLILAAAKISANPPGCKVSFLLSAGEEINCYGAKTAAFSIEPSEAIVVDVTFASSHGTPPNITGVLGGGPMIGRSPTLDRRISLELADIANSNSIPHQFEVMGGKTSTSADVIGVSRGGIPTGLLSVPLRYMHTPVETIDLADVEHCAQLIHKYVCKGGESDD